MAIAALLPMARAVFYDANGNPLANGLVHSYVPGGTVPKVTWQDAAETIPNLNPVVLDSSGSCLLYGSGAYQLTVTEAMGNAVPGYSGLTQSGPSGASDITYSPPWTASVPRPVSGRLGDYMSSCDFGCVGDGVTDTTVQLQAAIDAAIANQVPLFIQAGRYLITSALRITRGCHIFGSFVETQTSQFVNSTEPGGNGTWIVINNTGFSAFLLQPTDTPTINNQVFGVEIDHIAFIHNQASPAPGWTPTVYPATIQWNAAEDVKIHHCHFHNSYIMFSPTLVAGAASNISGRFWISDNTGQPLFRVAILDNAQDVFRFSNNHWWVYWSLDANVLAWMKAHLVGYQMGRVDNPYFSNEFIIYASMGVSVAATANGPTSLATFTACGFDQTGSMVTINDTVGQHTLKFVGCYNVGYLGDNANGVNITGTGIDNFISLTACDITGHDQCAVQISGGANNHRIFISNCRFVNWSGGATVPALAASAGNFIRADSACLYFSIFSTAIAGTTGQVIPNFPIKNLGQATILAANTSVVFPHFMGAVPSMFSITPVTSLSAASFFWASADGTNITINVNAAPTGGDVTFDVQAGVAVNS